MQELQVMEQPIYADEVLLPHEIQCVRDGGFIKPDTQTKREMCMMSYAPGFKDARKRFLKMLKGVDDEWFYNIVQGEYRGGQLIGYQVHHELFGKIEINSLRGTLLVKLFDAGQRKAFEKALFINSLEYDIVGDEQWYRINKYKEQ